MRMPCCWQADARKQLQDMFKGKEDVLSMYDAQPPGGGKGGSGSSGGGGGGGGDWRNFDWRNWGRKVWWRLRASLKGFATALGAALLFASVLILGESAASAAAIADGTQTAAVGAAAGNLQPGSAANDSMHLLLCPT